MDINAYNSYSSTAAASAKTGSSSSSSGGVADLGVDDFIKLMTTQLQNQDISNPASDTDFIAQMAQFTSLQETKTMTESMDSMKSTIDALLTNIYSQSGTALLGKYVEVGDEAKGTVDSVSFSNGTCTLMINGKGYDLSKVTTIANASK